MDFSSWARKLLLKKTDAAAATTTTGRRRRSHREAKEEEEHLGLTEELRELVKSFTIETFKTFPLQDDQQQTTTISGNYGNCGKNVEKDLSEWQERHAMLVLSQVKEISQLRYVLCPRHLKESQFWKIYFLLVKSLVSPYELRAIREEKLKRLGRQEEKSPNKAFEVEMSEAKQETSGSPTDLPVHKTRFVLHDNGRGEVEDKDNAVTGLS